MLKEPADRWALSFSHFNLIWFDVVKKSTERKRPCRIDFCSSESPRRITRACASMEDVRDFKLTIADAQENPSAFSSFLLGNANVSHAVTFFTVNCKCNKTQTKFSSLRLLRPTSTLDTANNRHATRRRPMKIFQEILFSFQMISLKDGKGVVKNVTERFVFISEKFSLEKCLTFRMVESTPHNEE